MQKKYLKKLTIFSTIATMSILSFSGCSNKTRNDELNNTTEINLDNQEENIEEKIKSALEQIEENTQKETTKTFEPYEHIFFVRVNLLTEKSSARKITGGNIIVPEGYTVLEIENFSDRDSYGSQTEGYDIWFTNKVPVLVESIFNESLEKYDFSNFGTPIIDTKEKEKIR